METAQHSYFAKKYAPKALHFCLKTQLKGVIIMKKKILAQQPSIEWISSLHTDKCDTILDPTNGPISAQYPQEWSF